MILVCVTAALAVGVEGLSIPLHHFPDPCQDRRYPALMSEWVVGCGPSGLVDRALSLETGDVLRFPQSAATVGFGQGPVFGRHGFFSFETRSLDERNRTLGTLIAPSFQLSDRLATLAVDHVSYRKGSRIEKQEAKPRGWYPPAILDEAVAWVEDDGAGGEDIMIWSPGDASRVLAGGAGHQRHVVSSSTHLAWLDDDRIVIHDPNDGADLVIEQRAVDRLSLWQDKACWAAWGGKDIDVFCSDGFQLRRPGHQLWPMHHGPWLIFTEEERLMLYRFEEANP